jgi:aquaporin Z
MKSYLIEGLGTFFLVLTIGLSRDPLAIAIALMSLVYIGASISGAHYNPAVTFALFLRKKISQQEAGKYIGAQFIGSIAATIALSSIFSTSLDIAPATTTPWLTAVFAEALFTFFLVLTVLFVAASKKTAGNQYFGLAIGGVVFAGIMSIAKISGGVMNPAVGLGPLLTNAFTGQTLFNPSTFFLYIIGPLVGGGAAAWVHKMTQE